MAAKHHLKRAESALRDWALGFPEAREDFPWGHRAIKVNGKIFAVVCIVDDTLNISIKLPVSGRLALTLSFAAPTEYGLGKSGWVTARFRPGDSVPVDMIQEWVDESYRAIAPKKLLAQLESAEDVEQKVAKQPPKRSKRRSK